MVLGNNPTVKQIGGRCTAALLPLRKPVRHPRERVAIILPLRRAVQKPACQHPRVSKSRIERLPPIPFRPAIHFLPYVAPRRSVDGLRHRSPASRVSPVPRAGQPVILIRLRELPFPPRV